MSSVTGPLWRQVSPYRQGRADIADEQAVRELRAALSHGEIAGRLVGVLRGH